MPASSLFSLRALSPFSNSLRACSGTLKSAADTVSSNVKSVESVGVGPGRGLRSKVTYCFELSTRFTTSETSLYPSRSEEHTSELQSHHDLVCRLLLEKKKKQHKKY